MAGHRAYFLRDAGLLLNQVTTYKCMASVVGVFYGPYVTFTYAHTQALISYGIAFLRKRQYSVLQPPYFMNRDMMAGVAQLEQFDEELYKVWTHARACLGPVDWLVIGV